MKFSSSRSSSKRRDLDSGMLKTFDSVESLESSASTLIGLVATGTGTGGPLIEGSVFGLLVGCGVVPL